MSGSLLEQFVSETRDLLEEIARGLLELEKNPGDAEGVNAVFRAAHTIKGSSGLFEGAAPLTRVVHAAEDVLDAVRDGRLTLDPDRVDLLLEAFDRVNQWVDDLEASEALPAGAEGVARELSGRLRALLDGAPEAGTEPPGEGSVTGPGAGEGQDPPDWIERVPQDVLDAVRARAEAEGTRVVAVEYEPDEACFFRGDDPLLTVRNTPGRAWVRVEPLGPWPEPAVLDPFRCALRFRVLACADPEAVREHYRYVEDQVRIAVVPPGRAGVEPDGPAGTAGPDEAEQRAARELLESQVRALRSARDPEIRDGVVASARAVAERALGVLGADRGVAQTRDPEALAEAIEGILARAAPEPAPEEAAGQEAPRPAEPAAGPTAAAPEPRRLRHLKVDQERIDALMDLVGELVVAKNSLPFLARRAEHEFEVRELARQIKAQYGVINRIAEDLQWAVMRVRMVPVSHVFQRFPRLVRDLSRKLGKRIELVIEGEETEADKNVVEDLAEPLVHLIRNAVDHGIEPPGEREAQGKPSHGTIRLRAVQRDDQVVIEVSDDGRGIDPDAVKRKAYERGLIDEERLETLGEQEALQLVFLPGFSTADGVSDVSGRGVGMDVVRAMVERTGGSVALESRKGMGTTVRLSLPLSMAVTRVMMVDAGGETFGIPMESVIETVRVPASRVRTVQGAEAVVWRDRVLPLYRLAGVLGLNGHRPHGREDAEEAVLVASVGGEPVGLVVERFHEGVDVLVKPLEGIMAGFRIYTGTAILGDGRVLLVLDLKELLSCR